MCLHILPTAAGLLTSQLLKQVSVMCGFFSTMSLINPSLPCRSRAVPWAGDHPDLGAVEAASASLPGSYRGHAGATCLMLDASKRPDGEMAAVDLGPGPGTL